MHFKLTT